MDPLACLPACLPAHGCGMGVRDDAMGHGGVRGMARYECGGNDKLKELLRGEARRGEGRKGKGREGRERRARLRGGPKFCPGRAAWQGREREGKGKVEERRQK